MKSPDASMMKFIVYSQTNAKTIAGNAGRPEYSYYYVVKHYMPILERLGEVHIVYEPLTEVDEIYKQCAARGQPCVFLHFSAPHNVFPDIKCPTIRIFAWEYSTIPGDPWKNEGCQDWRAALSRSAGAMTISMYTTNVVKETMGPDFPVVSVPCPVWDNFEHFRACHGQLKPKKSVSIHFDGVVVDSRMIDLHTVLPTDEEIAEKNKRGDVKMALMSEKNEQLMRGQAELLKREAELYEKIQNEWEHLNATRKQIEEAEEESLLSIKSDRENRWGEQRRTLRGRLTLLRGAVARFATDVTFALGIGASRSTVRRIWRRLLEPGWASPVYKTQRKVAERKAKELRDIAALEEAAAEEQMAKETEEESEQERRSDELVPNAVYLDGYVYTTIINLDDQRKNWHDLVIAFCWAFRDVEDATLVIKSTTPHIVEFADELVFYLKRLAPIKCRVVLIHAYLDDRAYDALMEATTYFVNTSYGEGQSIPLCEAMSAGIPAVAPNHTAMSEYVFPDAAFIFETNEELTSWQHDPRRAYRCVHYRPDWRSLVNAYRRSYDVAKNDPDKYAEMGAKAIKHLKNHCSLDVTTRTFQDFLEQYGQLFDHSGRSMLQRNGLRETA